MTKRERQIQADYNREREMNPRVPFDNGARIRHGRDGWKCDWCGATIPADEAISECPKCTALAE